MKFGHKDHQIRTNPFKSYASFVLLSGHFSLGGTKSKIAIVSNHDALGMVGTLDINDLWTPKGFSLGPLTAELWPFF